MARRCKCGTISYLNVRSAFARWLLTIDKSRINRNRAFQQFHSVEGIVGEGRHAVLILGAVSAASVILFRRFTAATGALGGFRLNLATTATLARISRRNSSRTVLLKSVRQARLHRHGDDE